MILFFISLLYLFVFKSSIKFNYDMSSYSVDVLSEFSSPNVTACYGNRLKCKKIDVSVSSDVDTSKIGDYKVTKQEMYEALKSGSGLTTLQEMIDKELILNNVE